jgi:serine/threonine protein kinase
MGMDQGTVTNPDRTARIQAVLSEVIDRRTAGEELGDEEIESTHSDLMPDLREELLHLREIERACSRGDNDAGNANNASDDQVIDPLSRLRRRLAIPGYELLSEINSGGQAFIFLARQTESGKHVALKVLRDGRLADDRQRERLRRETKILASLEHPNIVAFLDSGTTPDGQPFLVMNYIPGEPLDPEALASRMSLQERLQTFLTICHAVSAAHERGIVHRDIKPSNIRLDEAGVPHVLDFGLAANTPGMTMTRLSMTTTGQFLGSFLWASPEQLVGAADVTVASDVYSLGVLLHQLATGGSLPPHVFTTMFRSLGQQQPRNAASKLAKLQRELTAVSDKALARIIDRCLAGTPQERYANAGELATAVMEYLTEERRGRPSKNWPLRLSAAGFVVILLAVIGAFTWPKLFPASKQSQQTVNGRPIMQVPHFFAMVWIPPGQAILGSPEGTPLRMPDEYLHTVKFDRGFYLSCTEVTRGAWEYLMADGRQIPENEGQNPVADVSWYDAVEFCRRLSQREHRTFRLPTEDEWEYAARAGDDGAYPWFIHITNETKGDWRLLPRYANFADVSSGRPDVDPRYDDGHSGVAPVYTYLSNAWGLSDMIGNVWEWTGQPYRHDLSKPPRIPATQPLYISARGGSFFDNPHTFRYGNRNPLPADHTGGNVGFRVLCEDDGVVR